MHTDYVDIPQPFIQEPSVPEPFRQEHIIFRQEYIIWYNSICADSDTNAALVYMFRWSPYECNQAPAVPTHNVPPVESRDVVLAARAARHTSRDNRQARRLVSAANSASENDDDDGDDEATYVRMPFTLMPRRFTLMPRGLKMRRYMLRCKRPATRQHRRCTKFLTSASSKSFVIPFPTHTSLSEHFFATYRLFSYLHYKIYMTLHCLTCVYKVTSTVSNTVEPCSDAKSPAKATLSMPICSISAYTNILFTTSTMVS